jgi:hypothetical protein
MNTKINFYAKESIIKYTSKSLEMKIKKVYKKQKYKYNRKKYVASSYIFQHGDYYKIAFLIE